MKRLPFLLPAALAACGPATPHPTTIGPAPTLAAAPGLDRVLGQDAAGLVRLFGPASAEVREGTGRKLQFAGPICVLDAYLYPKDGAEPRVTWIDTREPDASPIDRGSCVAALAHKQR